MSDPTDHDPTPVDPGVYDTTGVPPGLDGLWSAKLPRRPRHGSRGVLVADRPVGLVHFLDADDDARTFRYRETRALAGDPADMNPPRDGTDHIVRAAIEGVYDVIAAPWAGLDAVAEAAPEQAPTKKTRRKAGGSS